MSLPDLSLRRPVGTAMFYLAVALVGVLSFTRLPVDLLPDVSFPTLTVSTVYRGAGPEEVERFVTERLEESLSRVAGVQTVTSRSREGSSQVRLQFYWGTDMEFAALHVRERLDNLADELPRGVDRSTILSADPTDEPILTLAATGRDLLSLRQLSEAVFRRRLEQLDGVALAAVAGGPEREIRVVVDPARMRAHGLQMADVADALDRSNYSAPGGMIRRGRFRYSLRTLGEFSSVDQIRDVAVPTGGGDAVSLGEVAEVEDTFAERETVARYDGRPAVGLQVYKESGTNTVRVADRVEETLEQLRGEYPEVTLTVAANQARFVRNAISNVVQALLLGGLLAFVVLFLFLREPRYPVAVGLAIPLSVLAAFSLCYAFDVSLNVMSLGGLALGVGMLVDNSIVVLENVFRHRDEEGRDPVPAASAGAGEVAGAITASTLTTVAVFGPVLYVEGVAGALFGDLSLAVAFSLLASLLVALTLLPVMSVRFRKGLAGRSVRETTRDVVRAFDRGTRRAFGPLFRRFDRGFRAFARRYERALAWSLEHRAAVVLAGAAALGAAVVAGSHLPRGLMPQVDEGRFRAELELRVGTPLSTTASTAERIEEILAGLEGVASVYTRAGRARGRELAGGEATGLHEAAFEVRLAPDAPRAQEVVAAFRERVEESGVDPSAVSAETGRTTSLGRALALGEADLAVKVKGARIDELVSTADSVRARLEGTPGLADVRVDFQRAQPEVAVDIDRDAVARHGLRVRDVADAIENYLRGTPTDRPYTEFADQVGIRVVLPDSARRRLPEVMELTVGGVPLSEMITVREGYGPVEIRREDQTRTVEVLADVTGGLGEAVDRVERRLEGFELPELATLEVGGENREMRESFRSLFFAFGLALFLVYLILAAQFESVVQPLVILISVPLASVGAVAGLWAADAGVNVMSGIGVVILVGIVVNDAIIKVDFINQRRREGLSERRALMEAGRLRLRPIVMTTVTTVLGLAPMALGWGAGADLRSPLAVAVIGGLLSATFLTLLVVPVVYSLLVPSREGAGASGVGEDAR